MLTGIELIRCSSNFKNNNLQKQKNIPLFFETRGKSKTNKRIKLKPHKNKIM